MGTLTHAGLAVTNAEVLSMLKKFDVSPAYPERHAYARHTPGIRHAYAMHTSSASSTRPEHAQRTLVDLSKKYMKLFSLLPTISLLIKIQASYLKHKLSMFVPGVPEKMDTFEQKKYFFTLKIFRLPQVSQDPSAHR